LSFTYEQAIIIGFIQGLTELFPISSLGHAILIPAWIGGSFREFISEENQAYLLITIAMHLASSVALFLVFRKRWLGLFAGTFRAIKNRNYQSTPFRVLGYIVIATIPVGVLGLALGDYFQSIFGKPEYSAMFLATNGLLLITAERLSKRDIAHEFHDSDAEIDRRVNAKTALAIGFGQSLALFAGISRFGVTMSAGLLRKLNHSVASDFAFLLSLPVIVGASIVKLPELFTSDTRLVLGQILLGSVGIWNHLFRKVHLMFPGLGTVINVGAILIGSLIGIFIGNKLNDKLRYLITDVLGCVTVISAADALTSYWDSSLQNAMPKGWPILVIVFSLLVGALIGSWLKIEDQLETIGIKLKSSLNRTGESTFVEGFVSASLIFVIGPLAILGSISDGMGSGIDQLILKSTLDGFTSIAFAASLGIGVALSSLPVGVYQFAWTAVGLYLGSILADYQIAAMTAVGGVLLIGISLRLLKIKEMAVANLLPALAIAPLFALLAHQYI